MVMYAYTYKELQTWGHVAERNSAVPRKDTDWETNQLHPADTTIVAAATAT
jgi:hypothetical protein